MVKKVFKILNREISGLHEAAYLLAFFALSSQILALFRDRLFAFTFGAGRTLDIYYGAFRVPDIIFVSVASLVSISVLVPFFMEKIEKGEGGAKSLIDSVFSLFFIAISLVCLVVFFAMPFLIPKVLPGFAGDPFLPDLISLSRIMLISPFLLGLSNFLASITQIYNRFFIYALSPILYNFGIIFGVLVFYPNFGILGLGWGVALGAFFHLFIQIPFILEKKLFPSFNWRVDFAATKKVVLLSLPRALTLGANQLATFFLVAMASVMSAGSIAVFNFSWNLQSVPLAIVGASYASAVFPSLSRFVAKGETSKFLEQMIISARHVIFWSVPMISLFVVLRAQIVRTILGAGNFSWSDTRLTAACLAIFIISVTAQSLLLIFVRGYYSLGKTSRPLIINVLSAVFIVILGFVGIWFFDKNLVFRFFLESLFKVDSLVGSEVLVLPLAYTVGTIINVFWHWVAFGGEFKGFSRPLIKTFFESFSASVIMGFVSYLLLNLFDDVFNLNTVLGIFSQGFLAGIGGITVGVAILLLMKNDEIREVWKAFHQKIWKAKVLGVDATGTTL